MRATTSEADENGLESTSGPMYAGESKGKWACSCHGSAGVQRPMPRSVTSGTTRRAPVLVRLHKTAVSGSEWDFGYERPFGRLAAQVGAAGRNRLKRQAVCSSTCPCCRSVNPRGRIAYYSLSLVGKWPAVRDGGSVPSNHVITSRGSSLLCACLIVKLRWERDQVLGLQWVESTEPAPLGLQTMECKPSQARGAALQLTAGRHD